MQLLLTDPSIERLDARLGPGPRLGQSRLDVDVLEGRWFQVSGRVSNDRSPDVGAENGELEASFRTLFGFGDPLRLRFTGSEGLREGAFSYSIPLTASDFRMFLAGEFTHADVVAASVSELDIEGNTETISAGVHYPIYRSLEQDLALEMSLDRRWSETRLLGRPFSFSPGVRNGETDITALRLVQGWQYRGRDRALAARSTFSVGIDALGATTNRTGPDGRFFAWLGQAQWAERLDDRGQLMIVRGDVQVAADPLLPIEEFAIGGFNTVRGYRENQLVRDSGWDASAEWRIPLFRLPMPYLSQAPDDGLLQLAPFVDAGGGWNKDRATPNPDIIYSVGAGLRWTPAPGWSAVFYYGKALQDVRNPKDKDLQDDGIHFEVRVQFF